MGLNQEGHDLTWGFIGPLCLEQETREKVTGVMEAGPGH